MTTLPRPYYQDSACTLYLGDAIEVLRGLPDESVHCVVTSPPYWGLRDYGMAGQIGLENTPEEYVAKMVEVFREVRRVLRSDGTVWCNLGDSYATNRNDHEGGGFGSVKHSTAAKHGWHGGDTLKPKDICGIPWRVAFALQVDGWWLRQDIIWHKPNPMPESVTDRCTKAHEYIFLLSKSARYFWDAEAIKEPSEGRELFGNSRSKGPCGQRQDNDRQDMTPTVSRNKRSVWTVPSQAYPESHFATFPEDLIKPCILAGTSARGCCPKCGAPWERVVDKTPLSPLIKGDHIPDPDCWKGDKSRPRLRAEDGTFLPRTDEDRREDPTKTMGARAAIKRMGDGYDTKTLGWQPTCECSPEACGDCDPCVGGHPEQCAISPILNPIPCTVLDPFAGSFTTGQVALELGRNCIGIELSEDYMKLAIKRTNVTKGLALA